MRDVLDYFVDGAIIVGALGTAGALIVVALSYRRAVEDRRRAQASKIFALPVSLSTSKTKDGDWQWKSFYVTVINTSDMPISEVSIALFDRNEKRVAGRVIGMLMPHTESSEINFPSALAWHADERALPGAIPKLQVEFTDSTGIRWQRKPDGSLEELS